MLCRRCGLAGPAAAHEPGTTVIEVESTDSGIDAQIDMPLDELGAALGQDIPTDTLRLSQVREVIVGYLDEQLHIGGEATGEWLITAGRITVIRSDGRQYVRAAVEAASDPITLGDRRLTSDGTLTSAPRTTATFPRSGA